MALLSLKPRIRTLIDERNYGTKYDDRMDQDPYFDGNDSESAANARRRVRAFLAEVDPVLYRADIIAFSHFGTIRALVAELLNMSDTEMMRLNVLNGEAFLFERSFEAGKPHFSQKELPPHILEKSASSIRMPDMVAI
jgi:broad specificity phosphatase PhoE